MIGCMHDGNDVPCPTCGTYRHPPKLVDSDTLSDDESITMDDSNAPYAGPSARVSQFATEPPAPSTQGGIVEENAVLLEENRKLTRSLLELQVETERLKQQQNLLSGLGRRRDSLSGLSSTSQPLGSMGQNSPAPSYRSTGGGNYTSGIVADVVREIRDICRVREDATFERLRNLQENHMWSINDTLQRLAKDVDTMQKSVGAARSDLEKLSGRVMQLESIVCLGSPHNHTMAMPPAPMPLFGGNVQQALLLQQLQQHQQQSSAAQQQHSPQSISSQQQVAGSAAPNNGKPSPANLSSMLRLNYGRIGTTDELFGGDATIELGNGTGPVVGSSHAHEASSRVLLLEKGEVELRRDLQDAIATKNEQSKKIAYLQKVVLALQKKVDSQATDASGTGIGVIGPVTDL